MAFWYSGSYHFLSNDGIHFFYVGAPGLSNGKVGFAVTAISVLEDAGTAYFTVLRTGGASGPIVVNWATADGSAVAGVDYVAASGQFVWADGDSTSRSIGVLINKTGGTGNVTFTITISQSVVQGYISTYTISPATVTVTILRKGNGELDFATASYEVNDPNTGTTTKVVTVQRLYAAKGSVGCSYHTVDGAALAGTDYVAASGSLSWADGESANKTITITINGRSGVQGTRAFTVVIDTPTGGAAIGATNIATVTIKESGAATDPTANGSIPQSIAPQVMEQSGQFSFITNILEQSIGYVARHFLWNCMAQKIGTVIGFGPATASFGQGTDFVSTDDSFHPTPKRRHWMRRINVLYKPGYGDKLRLR